MSETITRQIEGVCEDLSQRPGSDWLEASINIGRQYPVKVSSSLEEIKDQMRAAGNQRAIWTFSESDGNPNPHRPGTFFKNRWVSKVEVGGVLDPALAGQPGQQAMSNAPAGGGTQRAGTPRDEATNTSIERQVLIKAVFDSEHEWVRNLNQDQTLMLLSRLDDWMGRQRGSNAPAATPPAATVPAGEPPQDDDIPF